MENRFCSILESVLQYEQKSQKIALMFFGAFLIIFSIVAIIQFKKAGTSNKIVIVLIALVLCVVCVVYLIYCHKSQAKLQNDIANAEFVTYQGEFVHDDYQRDSFYHNIIITDGADKIVLHYPDYGNHYGLHDSKQIMPVGTFTGTIVYSKNSKIMVFWTEDCNQ